MIYYNGKKWRFYPKDKIHVGDRQIKKVYVGNEQVYPDKKVWQYCGVGNGDGGTRRYKVLLRTDLEYNASQNWQVTSGYTKIYFPIASGCAWRVPIGNANVLSVYKYAYVAVPMLDGSSPITDVLIALSGDYDLYGDGDVVAAAGLTDGDQFVFDNSTPFELKSPCPMIEMTKVYGPHIPYFHAHFKDSPYYQNNHALLKCVKNSTYDPVVYNNTFGNRKIKFMESYLVPLDWYMISGTGTSGPSYISPTRYDIPVYSIDGTQYISYDEYWNDGSYSSTDIARMDGFGSPEDNEYAKLRRNGRRWEEMPEQTGIEGAGNINSAQFCSLEAAIEWIQM